MGLHHIYAAVTLQAVCNSVQLPAFMASLSLLLAGREEELVKLNSVSQTLSGVAMLLAPIISSALLKTQGSLAWVFAFDLSTLLLAVLVMLATRIPAPAARYQGLLGAAERQHSAGSTSSTGSGDYAGQPLGTMASPLFSPSQQQQQHQQQQQQSAGAIVRKLWRDNAEAWCFLQGHKGLLALLLVVAQIQLSNGAFQILSTPIILSFTAEPAAIAGVLTVSGVGAMLGFALPVAFKHANAHRARTVLACVLGQGLLLLFLVVPRLPVIMAVAFGYMLLVPLSRSCREAIWMQKVPCDMQGRVFSLQHSIAKAALPVAAVLAGPLVDLILEPLVDGVPTLAALAGGAAPNAVGPGGGKTRGGRGSALLALLLGVANVGCAAAAFLHPLYRALDERPAAGEAWQHKE